ncbi:hypothetical protein U1701_18285 [Sphingomonas sp. PB2P19]|uniref:hypothetical protein n=1 Tax=Sphingomonas rhamnosi TaxID=3096156 RepID=UPI002FC801BE
MLLPIFRIADATVTRDALARLLLRHRVVEGHDFFSPPGLAFSGVPGQSVEDILRESSLAEIIANHLAAQDTLSSALARVTDIRCRIAADPAFSWASHPPARPPALGGVTPKGTAGLIEQVVAVLPAFVVTFLWPLLLVVVPVSAWLAWPARAGAAPVILSGLLFLTLVIGATLLTLSTVYLAFRRGERTDWVSTEAPTLEQSRAMFAHENAPGYAHNHMMSHTVRKPGLLRGVSLRLAFLVIAKLTALNPKPGFLGDIGTIHFARWITIPGTRDLIFFSNFGGSWESYLEDFITRAHAGLTGVWSNTIGFPKTTNLFLDGATDGERFKRFARESMAYTPFWYSAYPTLTTANIRTNALIHRGLHAETEVEAVEWLALFGSSRRPPAKLDTTQIQSIVFGGLGFKPEGRVVTVRLGQNEAANREWLRDLMPHVAFNDGRYIEAKAVVTVALTPSGLARLGLPADAIETFPPPSA